MSAEVSEEQLWSWVDRAAPELEEYLSAHPDRRAEVERVQGAIRGLADLSNAPEPPLPEQIGPYRVLRLIGAGGMGLVYEAEQQAPRRRVALKVIRGSSLADERMVRLFQREAQALARLGHEGIAAIYEAGSTADGLHYFAMEFVDGLQLSEHANKYRLNLRAKLELFRRVCRAVEHAHRHGVVHRDLKPANILVEQNGAPKVLDFGLARLAEGDLAVSLSTTDAGRLLGTLPYMSPEQALGDAERVDERSDVYALGVILYELITGRLPLDVSTTSLLAAVRVICERTPPRPGAVADVPAEVDAIALVALDKDAARRYSDAGALGDDIDRYLNGRPVIAQRPTRWHRMRKFVLRHKALTVLVALVLTLSLWGTWQAMLRVDYADSLRGGWHPEVSPYNDIYWRGDRPQVRLDDEWFELLEVDGVTVATIVQFCRETTPASTSQWRKRFEEDLWQVIWRMGSFPGLWANLRLRTIDGDRDESAQSRLWTTGRRRDVYRSIHDRRARAPFQAVRFGDNDTSVTALIDETWHELVSIDGQSIERLIEQAREERHNWQPVFVGSLPLLIAELTDEPLNTVRIVARGPSGATEVDLGDVDLTRANRRAALDGLRPDRGEAWR